MPRTLILNQNNIVQGSGNSTFQYDFPLGGINFADELIAVQQRLQHHSSEQQQSFQLYLDRRQSGQYSDARLLFGTRGH